MPKNCCVPFCKSFAGKRSDCLGLSFHEFPSNEKLREQWLRTISREGDSKGSAWNPSSRSVVCSLHFLPSDYRVGAKRKVLLPTSCPSQFPDYPVYKQPKVSKPCKRLKRSYNIEDPLLGDVQTVINGSSEVGLAVHEPPNLVNDPVMVLTVEVTCQTVDDIYEKLEACKQEINRLRVLLVRKNNKLSYLQEQYDTVAEKLKALEDSQLVQSLVQIDAMSEADNKAATFLIDQIENFGKHCPKWSEQVIRECILWKMRSSKGYEHVRSRSLLKLPCRSTLAKYLGPSTGESGITPLIKQRLQAEKENLTHNEELYASLIVDEMSLNPKTVYDKQLDKIFGLVELGNEKLNAKYGPHQPAKRLLCFVLSGLATHYIIPVAYYFTHDVKYGDLMNMTLGVLAELETIGFTVVRVVSDNHQTNIAMFKALAGGQLLHRIPHPYNRNHPLFLSFDPNHIIKNIRSIMLERKMTSGVEEIDGGKYLQELYYLQKKLLVKPVRFLTRAHVAPTNLEKMKVKRAVDVFSPVVIATLKFLKGTHSVIPVHICFRLHLQRLISWK